jgi:hypothetical protein
MAANYRLIAVQVGDSLKYATSINEINRIAGAIFPFRCENFQNNSITSSRAKLVHDWILSLASQKMGEDERNRLLKTFCYQLCSEDSLRATVHSILQAANIPLEEENKDNGEMIINLDNLKSGLQWWRKRDWPQDIHNADYYDIYNTRAAGPTEEWWRATVDRLSQWRAYRGPKPPNTKADISARGTRNLVGITSQYWKLIASTGTEPSIAYLNWEDVAPLFAIASDIKPVSPVFAGKMCHFLFPRLFIVMDNLATSVFDYEFY